jgi:ABC-type uncharacterized transport system YnjBCD ATPase subunit/GNAT superfamily N-acetyltransferase
MFDVPPQGKAEIRWTGNVPIEARPWNVGLIVGSSGAGKSSIMRQMFGDMPELAWGGASVLDDFAAGTPLQTITDACSAVGFNTIPAWLRPFRVLSNGERFRVDLARRIVELPDPVVVDEFTSVVDRQVAQIGSHAVQKLIRKQGRKFVAVTCHYDVIDWLQPDWILEPATMAFTWRSVQPRPRVEVEIRRCSYDLWRIFAPFHYLTKDLNRSARCFAAYINDRPVAFAGMLHRPHPKVDDIMGCSRLVTLPDWQGLGLAFTLVDACGSAYKAIGKRLHTYPAHPSLIRAFDRSGSWSMKSTTDASMKNIDAKRKAEGKSAGMGGRPCAVFKYVGPAIDKTQAIAFLGGTP